MKAHMGARARAALSSWVLASMLLASSCGAAPSAPDGGAPDGGGWVVDPPVAPSPPGEPSLDCPSGAARVELDGASVCEPWTGDRPHCATGERLAPGGCVPIATDCADVPPEVLTADARLVREGSTDGDGTSDSPFGSIDEAIAAGATVIALAPGRYEAPRRLDGVTIAGACPDRTTLEIASTDVVNATLRRLQITGDGAFAVSRSGELVLESVEVSALSRGVSVRGQLVVRGSAFRDLPATAIVSNDSVEITLEDVSFERIQGVAIEAGIGDTRRARVSAKRVVITDITPLDPSTGAIFADETASVLLEDVVIEDVQAHGVLLRGDQLSIDGLFMRRIAGIGGFVELTSGEATLRSVRVTDAAGGVVFGAGRTTVEDVVVERVERVALVAMGATVSFSRVLIDASRAAGVSVDTSEVTIRDLVVRNVLSSASDDGSGLLVLPGSHVAVERARIGPVEHAGLAVVGDAVLEVSDLEVHDVVALVRTDGIGFLSLDGGTARLTRAWIHDVHTAGVAAQDATVTADDLRVERVSTSEDGNDGVGVVVLADSRGASAVLNRASIEDTRRWGVIATGLGASLEAHSLRVSTVEEAPCCAGTAGGAAIAVSSAAVAVVERFDLRASAYAGIVATADVNATFTSGTVTENAIGLVSSGSLPVNTGSMPGLTIDDVDLQGNGAELQSIDAVIERPELSF